MSKFQVDKALFHKFVGLVTLRGELENKEMLLNVSTNNMVTYVVSASKILCVKGTLKGTFEDWGEVGIDNLTMFKNVVASTNIASLDVSKTENKIMLAGTKVKYSGVLRNPKYIVNTVAADKMQSLVDTADGNNFTLKSADIKEIIGYVSALSPTFLLFTCKNNKLTVNLVNQDNSIEVDFTLANVEDFQVKLSKAFVDLLQALSEFDVELSMKSDQPALLRIKDKDLEFEYLYAPLKK